MKRRTKRLVVFGIMDPVRFGGHFSYALAIMDAIMERRERREFTDPYKAEIVELIRTREKTATQLAQDFERFVGSPSFAS